MKSTGQNRLALTAVIISLFLCMAMLLGGCTSPQKKPLPAPVPPDRVPRMQVKPTPQRAPEMTTIMADLNGRAQTVPGVKKAYTIVLGNVALVGLETGQNSQATVTKVAGKIKADPRIKKAYVTAKPEATAKIRNIADAVAKGKPVTDYLDQIKDIIRLAD